MSVIPSTYASNTSKTSTLKSTEKNLEEEKLYIRPTFFYFSPSSSLRPSNIQRLAMCGHNVRTYARSTKKLNDSKL